MAFSTDSLAVQEIGNVSDQKMTGTVLLLASVSSRDHLQQKGYSQMGGRIGRSSLGVDSKMNGEGFLLVHWNRLDIDHGSVVHDIGHMPDGTHVGFFHPHSGGELWTPFKGAVLWDDEKIPRLYQV